MKLSTVKDPGHINSWKFNLDQRWPERIAIADCMVQTLVNWHNAVFHKAKDRSRLRLLELGFGTGELGQAVLDSFMGTAPRSIEYTAIDIDPVRVQYGKERLSLAGHRNVRIVQTDLKNKKWACAIGPMDAVFSLQTLHDVGGIEELEGVYRQIHRLLVPGGILVHADFVKSFEKDDPARPKRLSTGTHKGLLAGLGFVDFKCEMLRGKMACMSSRRW